MAAACHDPEPLRELLALLFPVPDRLVGGADEAVRHLAHHGVRGPVAVQGDRMLGRLWFTVAPQPGHPLAYTLVNAADDLRAELDRALVPPGDGVAMVAKVTRGGWEFVSSDEGVTAGLYQRIAQALRGTKAIASA